MKRHSCDFSAQKKYHIDLSSSLGLTDLMRFCVLFLVFSLSYFVAVSLGNLADFSEWLVMLDEELLIESISLSLVSVLLINPILIKQIWRVFYLICKAFYRLLFNHDFAVFVTPSLRSVEYSAHGCRAPPSLY